MKEKPIELRIRGIGAGGVGIADLPDGRVIFVPRTVPDDLALVRVVKEKERWARGEVEEILEAGEGRTKAPCRLYDECDGCSLQQLAYEKQLHWKGRIVGDALRRIGKLSVEDPEVEPSPNELKYRNKISLVFRRLAGGRVVAGFHDRKNRKRILDVDYECLLPEVGLGALWVALRKGWGPGGKHLPLGGELRLTLRVGGDGGALLIKGGRGDGSPLELLKDVPGLTSIWREERGGRVRHLAGETALGMSWLDSKIEVTGRAFVQVNQAAGELLQRHVLELAGSVAGKSVVEGYCGAGVLGKILANDGAAVVGIELDSQAVEEARRAAPSGFSVVEGKVEDTLGEHLPADLVLLNPPRAGLDSRIPELLRKTPTSHVIYVSCDPATLARDLERMGEDYQVQSLRSFDLFPQTGHVETVVSLRVGAD